MLGLELWGQFRVEASGSRALWSGVWGVGPNVHGQVRISVSGWSLRGLDVGFAFEDARRQPRDCSSYQDSNPRLQLPARAPHRLLTCRPRKDKVF